MSGVHVHDHERSAQISNRVKALIARLEAQGVTSDAQLHRIVESFLAKARPENGYRIVARAWLDAEFKARLLEDANAAVGELGIDLSHWAPVKLRVVENTDKVHNIIACTLCSCYPIALLGPSPAWYKSEAYRARAVSEPRAVLREFGVELPAETQIVVWDSTAEARYMVLPRRPSGTESLGESELASLVTRNGLIGTALV
jgi:nitrile hydratase